MKKNEPSMLSIINYHNLELSSVIQTASVDALVELLIAKGIIENLALRANDLNDNNTCTTGD